MEVTIKGLTAWSCSFNTYPQNRIVIFSILINVQGSMDRDMRYSYDIYAAVQQIL